MGEPIRVLQVLGRMDRGGAETMIMNLYRTIDRTKVQFDFIVHTTDHCAYDDEIKALDGRIYSAPRYYAKNHFQYKRWWDDFFNQHPEYRIIHGHVRSTASIYLGIAKKHKVVTIAHSHSTSSGNGIAALVKNGLQFPIRYKADYLFACSKTAGKWLYGEKACKEERFKVLKNAIDVKNYNYNEITRKLIRDEFGLNDKFVIGNISRFNAQKNHMFLLDIFKVIHDKNSNAVLILVGDGGLRHDIENKIAKLGLKESVILTGVRSDVPELLQSMDVFLFPSLFEGLGIVLIEAQAAGLKCFTSADVVPAEAKVTALLDYISLTRPAECWAERVLSFAGGYERKNTCNEICTAGYDIHDTAKWVQEFYISH